MIVQFFHHIPSLAIVVRIAYVCLRHSTNEILPDHRSVMIYNVQCSSLPIIGKSPKHPVSCTWRLHLYAWPPWRFGWINLKKLIIDHEFNALKQKVIPHQIIIGIALQVFVFGTKPPTTANLNMRSTQIQTYSGHGLLQIWSGQKVLKIGLQLVTIRSQLGQTLNLGTVVIKMNWTSVCSIYNIISLVNLKHLHTLFLYRKRLSPTLEIHWSSVKGIDLPLQDIPGPDQLHPELCQLTLDRITQHLRPRESSDAVGSQRKLGWNLKKKLVNIGMVLNCTFFETHSLETSGYGFFHWIYAAKIEILESTFTTEPVDFAHTWHFEIISFRVQVRGHCFKPV